jgi:hypothetical protein
MFSLVGRKGAACPRPISQSDRDDDGRALLDTAQRPFGGCLPGLRLRSWPIPCARSSLSNSHNAPWAQTCRGRTSSSSNQCPYRLPSQKAGLGVEPFAPHHPAHPPAETPSSNRPGSSPTRRSRQAGPGNRPASPPGQAQWTAVGGLTALSHRINRSNGLALFHLRAPSPPRPTGTRSLAVPNSWPRLGVSSADIRRAVKNTTAVLSVAIGPMMRSGPDSGCGRAARAWGLLLCDPISGTGCAPPARPPWSSAYPDRVGFPTPVPTSLLLAIVRNPGNNLLAHYRWIMGGHTHSPFC